ncbi:MAG: condensation domain-containing protein, partial [Ruminococcus sp.]|nr:condensation domain-containing protein [Ruminococcus sp.]
GVLRQCVKDAIAGFDSMRLRFIEDEDGTLYQYVVPFDEREPGFFDFSGWREEDANAEMERWTTIPFKRCNSPMNAVVMIKFPGGYNGVYLRVDHMTMDSSSLIAFDKLVLELYCARMYDYPEPKPLRSYIEAVVKDLEYEKKDSTAYKSDEAFWKEQIEDENEPMYTDFTGPGRLITQRRESGNPELRSAVVISKDPSAAISVYHLEEEPSARLMKFCAENRVTMAGLLLMGLRTVLSKFNNNEKDVSVKTCVARRGTLLEKYSGGTRIHFFPLRTVMEPETAFIDGIKAIQLEQNKIFRHANYDPIEYTMKRSQYRKFTPGASYESISLTYQPLTIRERDTDLPDIDYKTFWYSNGVAAQPLYLTVMHRPEDNGLNFNFEYRKDVVTEQEMEFLYYYLCRILFRGIEDKSRTIGEILDMI